MHLPRYFVVPRRQMAKTIQYRKDGSVDLGPGERREFADNRSALLHAASSHRLNAGVKDDKHTTADSSEAVRTMALPSPRTRSSDTAPSSGWE
jgi:hypothetical protein